ncbi:MAG: DcaP family trimeric outer membrane transporter [Luteimonas sp.]
MNIRAVAGRSSAIPLIRRVLATSVMTALLAPSAVFAQTQKEKELEARIAQLEKMVEQLGSQQQQTQTTVSQAQAQISEVQTAQAKAPAAVPAGKQPIQGTSILTAGNPGGTFSYGGLIRLDAFVTDTSDGRIPDGTPGRLFYHPGVIPVGSNSADGGDAYADVHAQFSRFWFSADTVSDKGDKFKAYIEADFYSGGNTLLGNEVVGNNYALSLRHVYVSWNKWLAGQTWSNFQDVAALPDSLDIGGIDGSIFVRQAQVRYTSGAWSFSAENPLTTVTPFLGASARFNSADSVLPDLTGRWMTKGDWGHFTVAGLVRQFKYLDETTTGASVSVSGKFNLGASDDIRYMVSAGSGLGRYLAFGVGSDTFIDANGELQALDGYSSFVAWRHVFSPKVRTNLMYAMSMFDNDTDYTGFGVTERAQSLRANVVYTPHPKLDIGAELTLGQRSLEDDREGDLTRLHTSVRYTF